MANAWNAGSAVLLEEAGFSSIGGSLARATFGFVRKAAKEMLDQGSFLYSAEQIPDGELCSLFFVRGSKTRTS